MSFRAIFKRKIYISPPSGLKIATALDDDVHTAYQPASQPTHAPSTPTLRHTTSHTCTYIGPWRCIYLVISMPNRLCKKKVSIFWFVNGLIRVNMCVSCLLFFSSYLFIYYDFFRFGFLVYFNWNQGCMWLREPLWLNICLLVLVVNLCNIDEISGDWFRIAHLLEFRWQVYGALCAEKNANSCISTTDGRNSNDERSIEYPGNLIAFKFRSEHLLEARVNWVLGQFP